MKKKEDAVPITQTPQPPKPSRLWTIVAHGDFDNSPLTDLVYCDREPTIAEIRAIHPHIDDGVCDEDIEISEYLDIPSVP
jgi:hypothetical protein